jgi:HEAT repeat protein
LQNILRDKQESEEMRKSSAEALGNFDGDEAFTTLKEILQDNQESGSLRSTASWALGQIDHELTVALLYSVLQNKQESPELRDEIVTALEARAKSPFLNRIALRRAICEKSPVGVA